MNEGFELLQRFFSSKDQSFFMRFSKHLLNFYFKTSVFIIKIHDSSI